MVFKEYFNYTNLVFEGGGMKGIAYAPIPSILATLGILSGIKKIAGTSAGSIISLLIALKYNPNNIETILYNLDFNDFKDYDFYTPKIYSFLYRKGIYTGRKLEKWIKLLVQYKLGNKNATFLDLKKKNNIELVITGTSTKYNKTVYFSYKTYPDFPLWLAVRISISIPGYFTPINIMDYISNYPEFKDDLFVDGGIFNNYPIWIFDNSESYEFSKFHKSVRDDTLGFKLVSSKSGTIEIPDYLPSIVGFLYELIETMASWIDNQYKLPCYWDRTVVLDVKDIRSTDFNISNEKKLEIIESSRETIKQILRNKIESYIYANKLS